MCVCLSEGDWMRKKKGAHMPERLIRPISVCMRACMHTHSANQSGTSLNPFPVTRISHQPYLSFLPSRCSSHSFFPLETIVPFPPYPPHSHPLSQSYYYPPQPQTLMPHYSVFRAWNLHGFHTSLVLYCQAVHRIWEQLSRRRRKILL